MPTSSSPPGTSDDDTALIVVVIVGGFMFAGPIGAFLLLHWHNLMGWLATHQVLLPSDSRPLLAIPGFAGAGLDAHRLAVVVGMLGCASAIASSLALRRWPGRGNR